MKEEKSLTKTNKGFFSKIIQNIRTKLLNKNNLKNSSSISTQIDSINTITENNALDDFEVLKDVMAGKKQIQYLDSDLKKRLIAMCNDRLISINKEIDEIHSKTGMMNSLILENI